MKPRGFSFLRSLAGGDKVSLMHHWKRNFSALAAASLSTTSEYDDPAN
jgi:hypothetical protein